MFVSISSSSLEWLFVGQGQCSSVPCGLLQVNDQCCQSSAAPLSKSPSAHRGTTPSHQVWSSGFFCCTSDSLELAARLRDPSLSIDTFSNHWRHTCLHCIRACNTLEALRNVLYALRSASNMELHYLPHLHVPHSSDNLPSLSGGKRGDYQNCSVLYCVLKLHTVISTLRWAVLTVL